MPEYAQPEITNPDQSEPQLPAAKNEYEKFIEDAQAASLDEPGAAVPETALTDPRQAEAMAHEMAAAARPHLDQAQKLRNASFPATLSGINTIGGSQYSGTTGDREDPYGSYLDWTSAATKAPGPSSPDELDPYGSQRDIRKARLEFEARQAAVAARAEVAATYQLGELEPPTYTDAQHQTVLQHAAERAEHKARQTKSSTVEPKLPIKMPEQIDMSRVDTYWQQVLTKQEQELTKLNDKLQKLLAKPDPGTFTKNRIEKLKDGIYVQNQSLLLSRKQAWATAQSEASD